MKNKQQQQHKRQAGINKLERKVKGNRKNRTNRKGHLLHCKNHSKFSVCRRLDILRMPIL